MSGRMRSSNPALLLAAALLGACSRSSQPASEAGIATSPSLEHAVIAGDAATQAAFETAVDPQSARANRERLVRSIAEGGYVKSKRVLEAMRRVPRHLFVPTASEDDAYGDWPLAIGSGQTISQPSVVGEMTEALELRSSDRVLEIGTGSGYQTAVLSLLAREVYTIEIVAELGGRAERRLSELGYRNVRVRIGDGYRGWPEQAPFDRVIVTAAPPELPKPLLEQLAEGGVLVAPVGEQGQAQWLLRMRKKGGQIKNERLNIVRFVPMVRGN
jgi:protein-L-isoaspartate(D-aspartate) O-methyltransferase